MIFTSADCRTFFGIRCLAISIENKIYRVCEYFNLDNQKHEISFANSKLLNPTFILRELLDVGLYVPNLKTCWGKNVSDLITLYISSHIVIN